MIQKTYTISAIPSEHTKLVVDKPYGYSKRIDKRSMCITFFLTFQQGTRGMMGMEGNQGLLLYVCAIMKGTIAKNQLYRVEIDTNLIG